MGPAVAWTTGLLVLLLAVGGHPLAAAQGALAPLPPASIAPRIVEPVPAYAESALDPLLDKRQELAWNRDASGAIELPEEDVLLAITLGQRSGVPLGVEDVADLLRTESVASESLQRVVLPEENVFAALALGLVAPTHSAAEGSDAASDLFGLYDRRAAYATVARTALARDFDPATVFGGLVLLANGVPVDPLDLRAVSTRAAATGAIGPAGGPFLVTETDLPLQTAFGAAALGLKATPPAAPTDLVDRALRTSSRTTLEYVPGFGGEEVILAGVIFHNLGDDLRGDDLLSKRFVSDRARVESAERSIDLEDALAGLVVGLGRDGIAPA